ncbi:unnamed protein product [Boreogadus saida]
MSHLIQAGRTSHDLHFLKHVKSTERERQLRTLGSFCVSSPHPRPVAHVPRISPSPFISTTEPRDTAHAVKGKQRWKNLATVRSGVGSRAEWLPSV